MMRSTAKQVPAIVGLLFLYSGVYKLLPGDYSPSEDRPEVWADRFNGRHVSVQRFPLVSDHHRSSALLWLHGIDRRFQVQQA